MPWPTVPVVTTGMDADTDTLPRVDILDHTNKFNQLIAMRGVANGVCDLDGSTLIPSARLPAVYQPLDATLTALADALTGANKIPYATALDTLGELTRSIDGTLASNSDTNIPTEKAVRTYADSLVISAPAATPDTAADYFLFEDATDSTQKRALLNTISPRSVMTFKSNGIASGATEYMDASNSNATIANVNMPMPFDCTIKNMFAKSAAAPGASQTYIYTLFKNGVGQTLTCTITDPATTASDTTNSVSVAAGDLISVRVIASGSAANTFHHVSVEVQR